MRQNNDTSRVARIMAAVNDTLADLGQTILVYRAQVLVSSTQGIVDAEAHGRVAKADLSTYHFLYRIFLRLPVEVQVDDLLFANGEFWQVLDLDLGVSLHTVMTALCQRLQSDP